MTTDSPLHWHVPSYRSGKNDACVEVALAPTVAVRDTKDRAAATARVSAAAWAAFIGAATTRRLGDPTGVV
ncbi:DUF397 domain-containing protein [Streptomyces sp. MS19]|uniref:DUF397 domain-containing protein n=1 Tax=Streptomyces sp. MS19 TaxID=3385972 RepID=UPI0039A21C9E